MDTRDHDYAEFVKRASRSAAVSTAIGAVIVGFALLYGVIRLGQFEQRVASQNKQIADTADRLAKAESSYTALNTSYRQLQERHEALENTSEHMSQGVKYYYAKEYEKAIKEYDAVLMLTPGDFDVRCLRASPLYALKRYDEALTICMESAAENLRSAKPRYTMALCLFALGRHDEAATTISEILELNPENCQVLRQDSRFRAFWAQPRFRDLLEEHDKKISRMQVLLKELGYYSKEPDGLIGLGTTDGLKRFTEDARISKDDYSTSKVLAALEERAKRSDPKK